MRRGKRRPKRSRQLGSCPAKPIRYRSSITASRGRASWPLRRRSARVVLVLELAPDRQSDRRRRALVRGANADHAGKAHENGMACGGACAPTEPCGSEKVTMAASTNPPERRRHHPARFPVRIEYGNYKTTAQVFALPRPGDRIECSFPSDGIPSLHLQVDRISFREVRPDGSEPYLIVVRTRDDPDRRLKALNKAIFEKLMKPLAEKLQRRGPP
jgi:hypothetical protein